MHAGNAWASSRPVEIQRPPAERLGDALATRATGPPRLRRRHAHPQMRSSSWSLRRLGRYCFMQPALCPLAGNGQVRPGDLSDVGGTHACPSLPTMRCSGRPMQYLSPRSGALIEWLRAELPAAVAVTAACVAVDADGLSLLTGPIGGFLDGGGRLRVLVATARAATAAREVLDAPGRDVVVQVTGDALPIAAYVVTSVDGLHRAYLGGTTWTETSLLKACSAVLFDLRRDSQAVARLLSDVTGPGHADVPEPALDALEELLQAAMTALEAVSETRSLRTGAITPGRRGTPTGLAALDALIGGVWPGDLWC